MSFPNPSLTHIQLKPVLRLMLCSLFVFISLLSVVTLFAQRTQGAEVTLAWNPSGDTTVTGYKLYWSTQPGQYALLSDVGSSTSEIVSNLQTGSTYYFAATSYNAQKVESPYSNEASYIVPVGCTYSITPTYKTFTASGEKGTVSVTTQGTCSWTALSGASWITITPGTSGTGSGTVVYTVLPNTAISSRTANLTIAG